MDAIGMTIVVALASYVAAGLMVGLAFVTAGVGAVQNAPVTAAVRILLLPGATALWPLVLCRWLQSRRNRS